jgi:hypothetical protein
VFGQSKFMFLPKFHYLYKWFFLPGKHPF